MKIRLFQGAIPARSPRLLPDRAHATYTVNCDFRSGQLKGIRRPRKTSDYEPRIESPARVDRIKRLGKPEYAWVGLPHVDANIVRSPVVNDAFDRFYVFSPDRKPGVTTFDRISEGDGEIYDLEVPRPRSGASVVSRPATGPLAERRAYVYTYVTEWGEESGISQPFFTDALPSDTVVVRNFYDPGADSLQGREFRFVRFYRTVTSAAGSDFFFVADVPWGELEWRDDIPPNDVAMNRNLGAAGGNLPSGYYGALTHPSGSILTFKGNSIRFSRPFMPHSWPEDYEIALPDEVVAAEMFDQNVVVLTDSRVYLLFGNTPPNLGILTYPGSMPCIGRGTVCNVPGGIVFGTNDGVAFVGREQPTLVSSQVIRRDQWRQSFSKPYRAFYSDGVYYGFLADGLGFQFPVPVSTFDVLHVDEGAVPTFDFYTNTPFLLYADGLYEWTPESGPYMEYRWDSGDFFMTDAENIAAARVWFDPLPLDMVDPTTVEGLQDASRTVLFTMKSEGEVVYSMPVASGEMIALPGGYKSHVVSMSISGQCPVHLLEVGRSMVEVQND